MPLEPLARYYYTRQKELGDLPPFGFASKGIHYIIDIGRDGAIQGISPAADPVKGKAQPRMMIVPNYLSRTGKDPKCALAWDNQEYIFGFASEEKKGSEKRAYDRLEFCRDYHLCLLENADSEACRALRNFFKEPGRNRNSECLKDCPELAKPEAVCFCFRFEGKFLHEDSEIIRIWKESGYPALAEIEGNGDHIGRLHPQFRLAGKESLSLVSYNSDSSCSFGKKQGDNFPMDSRFIHAYGASLNALLREQNFVLGNEKGHSVRAVCWSDTASAEPVSALLCYFTEGFSEFAVGSEGMFRNSNLWLAEYLEDVPLPDEDEDENGDKTESESDSRKREWEAKGKEIADSIRAIRNFAYGIPADIARASRPEDAPFYFLSLRQIDKGNCSVDFFAKDSLRHFCSNILRQTEAWTVAYRGQKYAPSFSAISVLLSGLPKITACQCREYLLRSFLYGSPLPDSVFELLISRNADYGGNARDAKHRLRCQHRADCIRASAIKAYYTQKNRNAAKEATEMSLDQEAKSPAYLLGRALAITELLQQKADRNIQKTIRQRAYKMAMYGSPADMLDIVACCKENYLPKLEPSLQVYYDTRMREAVSGLCPKEGLPRRFSRDERCLFHMGYYHQKEYMFTKKEDRDSQKPAEGQEQE